MRDDIRKKKKAMTTCAAKASVITLLTFICVCQENFTIGINEDE